MCRRSSTRRPCLALNTHMANPANTVRPSHEYARAHPHIHTSTDTRAHTRTHTNFCIGNWGTTDDGYRSVGLGKQIVMFNAVNGIVLARYAVFCVFWRVFRVVPCVMLRVMFFLFCLLVLLFDC